MRGEFKLREDATREIFSTSNRGVGGGGGGGGGGAGGPDTRARELCGVELLACLLAAAATSAVRKSGWVRTMLDGGGKKL